MHGSIQYAKAGNRVRHTHNGDTGTIYGVIGQTIIVVDWDNPRANRYTFEDAKNLEVTSNG